MSISLVAAIANNRVIGRENQLLWRIKSDLQHFRKLTLGKPVIMGRKTFESIGRPLPGRDNIIVTRDATFEAEGTFVVSSLEAALERAQIQGKLRETDRIIIAGGGDIYRQTIGMADQLFITEVEMATSGDAFFPEIHRSIWQETHRETHPKGPDDDAAYAFVEYRRR